MKKLLVSFLFSIFFTLPVYAGSYPDVAEDHENFDAIEYLDDHDVINGYEDGTFGPDNSVTRAEAIKIILNALEIETESGLDEFFPDVETADWFFDHVMTAYENDYVSGYNDGEFKPSDEVSLSETLKILLLAADVELEDNISTDVFNDVDNDDWFASHMLYAKEMNIIISDNDFNVYPSQDMTRAAFAEVVYRMMIVLETDDAFQLSENWPYYEGYNMLYPFKMKYKQDDYWGVSEQSNDVTFWRVDRDYYQFSPLKIYPNSAVIRVVYDYNDEDFSQEEYFDNIKYAFSDGSHTEFELNGLPALEVLYSEDRVVDWYVYLEDNTVFAIYTEYGDGNLAYQNQQIIKSMLSSFEYLEVNIEEDDDYSDLLSEILENILVENTGEDTLDLLPDSTIIETDTIGVGTGPVDYYYSETLDYTFKYERDSDVILDYREGETTAF